ncbi:unnamed protein product, partial [Mesorhabditis belari]|uniref:Uncharacterized protein n=1 Tax=Mesorhabditis belari TaxID=2138241 RepID=A0AAF3EV72_9BILA
MRFTLQSLCLLLAVMLAMFSNVLSAQDFSPKEVELLQILSRNKLLPEAGRWKRGDLERFQAGMEILNRNRCFFNPVSC